MFGLLTIFIPSSSSSDCSWCDSLETVFVLLYVLLCGLQGFFIFCVFVANRRVLNLYKGLWGRVRDKARSKVKADDGVEDEVATVDVPQGGEGRLRTLEVKDAWLVCSLTDGKMYYSAATRGGGKAKIGLMFYPT